MIGVWVERGGSGIKYIGREHHKKARTEGG